MLLHIDTTFLRRCIADLERGMAGFERHREGDDVLRDVFRAASAKEFELVLEQSGKLLRKRLVAFFASNRQADRLVFKDLFRHAAKHGLMEAEAVGRWLRYRDNRNDTAHNCDERFAEATLNLLPAFVVDAKALADMIEEALRESAIPFLVEARDWARLPERFHREIERDHVVLAGTVGHAALPLLPFSKAFKINPKVRLERGGTYPYVDMAAIGTERRSVSAQVHREFKSGGSRFECGDTLMARIAPCLENGKIARFVTSDSDSIHCAHGSTEFIVIRGHRGITETDFAYYLTRWDKVRSFAVGQMRGTSGRQRVPTDCFDDLFVPIPSLPVSPRSARRCSARCLF